MSRETATSPPPTVLPEYASLDEARNALAGLSKLDIKRLQFVARLHGQQYGLPPSHMEPDELLNEAIQRTLDGRKQWRVGVKFAYHLDRAMENIAGHEVPKLLRKFDVGELTSNESEDDEDGDPLDRLRRPKSTDGLVAATVEAREDLRHLEQLFHDDAAALDVLKCRAAGQEGKEIQLSLGLSKIEHDTINKRILRKTTNYYEPKSKAVPQGRGA